MTHGPDSQALLRAILSVIGAVSAGSLSGCTSRHAGDGESEGDTGRGTQADLDTGNTTRGQGQSDADSSHVTGDGSLIPDVGSPGDTGTPIPDVGNPGDTGTPIPDAGNSGDTGDGRCGPFLPAWGIDYTPPAECGSKQDRGVAFVCFVPPDGTTCEQEPYSDECILDAYKCGLTSSGQSIACGPDTTDEGACCYVVQGDCAVGRPFTIDGHPRLAALEPGEGWDDAPIPETAALDAASRAALADAWRRHGQTEHASIASFARFTIELLALAAPPGLVAASVRAGADERHHALRCLGLANVYAGTPSRPGPLDVAGGVGPADPIEIAQRLASEGCVAETVSLRLLTVARDRARDPAVRACLTDMIDDEYRHVLLAWEALAWLCRRFGQPVRSAVAEVFAEPERHVGFGATTVIPGDATSMRAHGYLTIDERRAVAIDALRDLVAPAAHAL